MLANRKLFDVLLSFPTGVVAYTVGFVPAFYFGKKWVVDKDSIIEEIRAEAGKIAVDSNLELVHVELRGGKKNSILRIFIDKPEGITHTECAHVSGKIDEFLEEIDLIDSSYVLEVSSPGINRGLYKRADYKRFEGSKVKIKTRKPIEGQRNFVGKLLGIDKNVVSLEEKKKRKINIDFDSILKANLIVDIESEIKVAKGRRK